MILLTGLPVSAHTYSIIPYPKSLIPQEGEYIFKNGQKFRSLLKYQKWQKNLSAV